MSAAENFGNTDPQQVLYLYERLGEIHILLNHREQAESVYRLMLEKARQVDDPQAVGRALCQLSMVQGWLHRLDEARRTGDEALRLAEEIGDDHLLALNHFNLGHLSIISGNLQQAQQHLSQAEQSAQSIGIAALLARTLQNQAYVATFAGHYREAKRLAEVALASAVKSGDVLALTGTHFALGLALTELGDYAQGYRILRAGLEHAQVSGETHYLAKLLNTLGYLHHEVGDFDKALYWDRLALETCRQPEQARNWEAECYSLLNLATDELALGHIRRAEEFRREAELILPHAQMSRFRFLNRYYLLCAELALARREPEVALENAKQAADFAGIYGVTKNLIKSLLIEAQALIELNIELKEAEAKEAEAKEVEAAVPRLRRAINLVDEIEHGSLRWKSRLRLAQLYALLGRANADLFGQAQALVNSVASHLDEESLRAAFSAMRAWAASTPPTRRSRANLSPRQP